jgi:hypothetical protein
MRARRRVEPADQRAMARAPGGPAVLAAVLFLLQANVGTPARSTIEEQRRIPWAPRVIAREEVAVLANVDAGCRVEASIAFQVFNFKLQQDGDVLYRYGDGSLLQEGQLGRGDILCGVEGHTPYGKPVFDCSLRIAWRADLLLTPTVHDVPPEEDGRERAPPELEPVLESVLGELPAGRPRLAAKLAVSKVPRLVAQVQPACAGILRAGVRATHSPWPRSQPALRK